MKIRKMNLPYLIRLRVFKLVSKITLHTSHLHHALNIK